MGLTKFWLFGIGGLRRAPTRQQIVLIVQYLPVSGLKMAQFDDKSVPTTTIHCLRCLHIACSNESDLTDFRCVCQYASQTRKQLLIRPFRLLKAKKDTNWVCISTKHPLVATNTVITLSAVFCLTFYGRLYHSWHHMMNTLMVAIVHVQCWAQGMLMSKPSSPVK